MWREPIGRKASKWRKLLRQVARATGSPQNAEDYLHSAFLRLEAYSARNTVKNPEGLLVKIAANLAIDEDRRARRWGEADRPLHDMPHLTGTQPLQDEMLEVKKRLERVRHGLERLPPRTREIFLMHRIEGRKYREIAAHFDISMSAVEKHIAKAALFLAEWTEDW